MNSNERKNHWENIYNTKSLNEVSWYQPTPETSLDLISSFGLDKEVSIIDIGGGDSFLVDHLLKLGYNNITVLDISEKAIQRAKERLGKDAEKIKWISTDITEFKPSEKYDVWHDRAAFHFLTSDTDIKKYKNLASSSINQNGHLIIGTFSINGPYKCSGINIKQYDEKMLSKTFDEHFELKSTITLDHTTPFNTTQNFIFCTFNKI